MHSMKAKGKRRNQQRTEEKDNQESAVKVSAFGNTKLQKERKMMLLNKKNDKETDKKSARWREDVSAKIPAGKQSR